ncbi:MAG: hypothetical protein R3Y44_03855 [Rikenellaceae bacterium]
MKKVLLLSLTFSFTFFLFNCSGPTSWSQEERATFITSLDDYRDMVYLNEFNDDEFIIFTSEIGSEAERRYPVYTKFIVMPALSDTLDMWVVTSIVEDLDTDAANMRYLYPYNTLVSQGILPVGLDHKARESFYRCFSQKVNLQFGSLESFFYAVITNSIEPNEISKLQNECATELFGYSSENMSQVIKLRYKYDPKSEIAKNNITY